MNTFYITSLGCKVNSYEIDAIKDDLVNNGYVFTNEQQASFIIVNTCCVTASATPKSAFFLSLLLYIIEPTTAKAIKPRANITAYERFVKVADTK